MNEPKTGFEIAQVRDPECKFAIVEFCHGGARLGRVSMEDGIENTELWFFTDVVRPESGFRFAVNRFEEVLESATTKLWEQWPPDLDPPTKLTGSEPQFGNVALGELDLEFMTLEIQFQREQMAHLSMERGVKNMDLWFYTDFVCPLTVEFRFPLSDFQEALTAAKVRLAGYWPDA